MLKYSHNFDIFYNSVITNKKVFYQNIKTTSEVSDSKFISNNSFIFDKKNLFLFNTKGNLLFSEPEIENNDYIKIINTLIANINKKGNKSNRIGNRTTENIYFNIFFVGEKEKIVIIHIGNINIFSCGVFSSETKTSIIKLYLLNFLIMFLNYYDIEQNSLQNIDNNNIQINIYKEFLFYPFHEYFIELSRQIFKRQKFKFKNIFYKNYYLLELNSNKIIFSFETLYTNIDTGENKYQIKTHNNEHIWNEVLYHCHILKNNYINQYSINFNEENYENYFAIFELKSTFPRRTFIIKFLPVLNGLAIIHEFVQTKLCSNEGNDNNHYKEYESIYGYFNEVNTISQKTCNSTHSRLILFKTEPIILKKINSFFVETLSLKNQYKDLFFWKKNKNIYICEDIMKIINNYLIKDSFNNNNIIKKIEKKLYEEYLQEIKQNNDIDINIQNNNNNNILLYNNNDYFIEDNISQKIELNITKNFILKALFTNDKTNNLKLSSIKENSIISKKLSGSRKEFSKFSDILNENISENICSYNHSNKQLLKENSSIKFSNIFESNNNNMNRDMDNSANLFNINISIIKNKEKDINYKTKNKKEEDNKINDIYEECLNSNEEFCEGEKNEVL